MEIEEYEKLMNYIADLPPSGHHHRPNMSDLARSVLDPHKGGIIFVIMGSKDINHVISFLEDITNIIHDKVLKHHLKGKIKLLKKIVDEHFPE